MSPRHLLFVCFVWLTLNGSPLEAQERVVGRLFWQDDTTATLRYGDLKRSGEQWSLTAEDIAGFPELKQDQQSLVQMQAADGLILVGVHDQEEGTLGSGWVAVESGAVEEAHGDHSHWRLRHAPKVVTQLIDEYQGNPAHVYRYGNTFALANDKKNGFTLTSSKQLRDAKTPADAATFYPGGNGHITLAVVEDAVAYATWMAPAGENAGRIDVVGLGDSQGKSYHLQCPTGVLHGATVNGKRAFFAPADGVCWVDVDTKLEQEPSETTVHHLSLGKSGDNKPLRTGAFTNIGRHVVFATGRGGDSKLAWIDAQAENPVLGTLPIELEAGQSMMSPITVRTRSGQSLACLFCESSETPTQDLLLFIDLDPNRDGSFSDASVVNKLNIGPNRISGHAGHHDACLLGDRRHLAITNPGDGTIWLIALADMTVQARFAVSGEPTRLISVGE